MRQTQNWMLIGVKVGSRLTTNGYRSMWAAEGEADIRTVVDTARLGPGTNAFNTILQTVSA